MISQYPKDWTPEDCPHELNRVVEVILEIWECRYVVWTDNGKLERGELDFSTSQEDFGPQPHYECCDCDEIVIAIYDNGKFLKFSLERLERE